MGRVCSKRNLLVCTVSAPPGLRPFSSLNLPPRPSPRNQCPAWSRPHMSHVHVPTFGVVLKPLNVVGDQD